MAEQPALLEMLDQAFLAAIARAGIDHCLIGAAAFAFHGVARYTADIDLLTTDENALRKALWDGIDVEMHRGDDFEPLAGLVRTHGAVQHDLIVGRTHAARLALTTAVLQADLGLRVAQPLALVLLKLEAGSARDLWDVSALVDAQRVLGTDAWVQEIHAHVPKLTRDGQVAWADVRRALKLP